jgi:hypothetical protein
MREKWTLFTKEALYSAVYSSCKRSTVVACTVGMFSFMTVADCVHGVQVGTVLSDGVPFIKGTLA